VADARPLRITHPSVRPLVVAVLAGVLASSALAAAGDPTERHTPAGTATAQKALRKLSDFPKGWKAKTAKPSAPSSACKDTRPNVSDLTEIGYAAAPDFNPGEAQSVSQFVRTYAGAAQAEQAFMRTDTIGLVSCLSAQLRAASTAKATIAIKGQYRLAPPRSVQEIDGFRVGAHANVAKE
jgi:hypothetical protein